MSRKASSRVPNLCPLRWDGPHSRTAADATGITLYLYQANLRTYQFLRFGVPVQVAVGKAHETVHLMPLSMRATGRERVEVNSLHHSGVSFLQ
ncbi:MAG: hypothetical protein ACREH8_19220 [Opitutaceae bacterium]